MTLRIALDLDNTVVDFTTGFASYLNSKPLFTGRRFPTHSSYDLVKSGWFFNQEEFREYFYAAEQEGLYRTLCPFPDAVDVVKKLAVEHTVTVVTARKARFNADTKVWLGRHGLGDLKVVHTDDKENVIADFFLDDADYQLTKLSALGRPVLAHCRPYNAALKVRRFTSWKQVPDLVTSFDWHGFFKPILSM